MNTSDNLDRNATVISERDVQLLMIPKAVYLKHWHHLYTVDELVERLVKQPGRQTFA